MHPSIDTSSNTVSEEQSVWGGQKCWGWQSADVNESRIWDLVSITVVQNHTQPFTRNYMRLREHQFLDFLQSYSWLLLSRIHLVERSFFLSCSCYCCGKWIYLYLPGSIPLLWKYNHEIKSRCSAINKNYKKNWKHNLECQPIRNVECSQSLRLVSIHHKFQHIGRDWY